MLSPSFTTATTFSGQIATSPTGHVRSRPVLAFATATEADYRPTPSLHLSTHGDSGMASCSSSLYEILGIAAAASDQEIKAAYRRLARVRQPDVAAVDRKDSSADEFMKIHAAYSTLSDPEKRASYDRSMNRRSGDVEIFRLQRTELGNGPVLVADLRRSYWITFDFTYY